MDYINVINQLAGNWSAIVIAVAWQVIVLTCIAGALAFALRRHSPAIRFWLWQLVALKLLLMPLWTLTIDASLLTESVTSDVQQSTLAKMPTAHASTEPIADQIDDSPPMAILPIPRRDASTIADPLAKSTLFTATSELSAAPALNQPPNRDLAVAQTIRWQGWLFLTWLCGVLAQLALLIHQGFKLRSFLKQTVLADAELNSRVKTLAHGLHVQSAPLLVVTDVACSPFACGFLKPRIVLPRSVVESLNPEQLDQVLLHELAHIKRGDLLWNWIPALARIVWFFHPVVYLVGYFSRLERELACDRVAISASGNSMADYAQTLIRVISKLSEPSVAATATAGLDGNANSPTHPEVTR